MLSALPDHHFGLHVVRDDADRRTERRHQHFSRRGAAGRDIATVAAEHGGRREDRRRAASADLDLDASSDRRDSALAMVVVAMRHRAMSTGQQDSAQRQLVPRRRRCGRAPARPRPHHPPALPRRPLVRAGRPGRKQRASLRARRAAGDRADGRQPHAGRDLDLARRARRRAADAGRADPPSGATRRRQPAGHRTAARSFRTVATGRAALPRASCGGGSPTRSTCASRSATRTASSTRRSAWRGRSGRSGASCSG